MHKGEEPGVLAGLWEEMQGLLWRLICAFYAAWWRIRHPLSKGLYEISKFTLVVASFVEVVELVLGSVRHRTVRSDVLAGIALCFLCVIWWKILKPQSKNWYEFSKIILMVGVLLGMLYLILFSARREEIAHWLGGTGRWVLVAAALLVLWHRVQEWVTRRQGFFFMKGMEPLFDSLGQLGAAPVDKREQEFNEFVHRLLSVVHETFKEKHPTNTNVMFPGQDGNLRIFYLYPRGTKYDPIFSLQPNQGGAGVSYAETKIVYIPAIRYRHGIGVTFPEYLAGGIGEVRFALKPLVYRPIPKEYEVYKSILSVPITSPQGTHGVLNLDSKHQDAFDDHDFHVANSYARALGVAILLRSR